MTGGAKGTARAQVPSTDELLRLILESAVDYAIFSMDRDGLVTSWNAGAQRVLGYAEDEMLGRSADVIFTAEDRAVGVPERERAQAARTGRADDDRWQLRKDGSRFWASGLAMRLADPELGFVKILRDRTEPHLAQERLREHEERFRILATNIPQLVFRSRPDGMRTWGSPQWIDFTGLSLAESLDLGWLDAVHPDDRAATVDAWDGARAAGEYYVEHRVRRRADGAYRWHQTRARPVQVAAREDPVDWVGTMTDVHDLRQLKDRQEVLMAELQHRTRNLLAVVQSVANRTLHTSDSLDDFAVEFEGRLRALSRVQAMLARIDQREVDLRELVVAELGAHGGNAGRVRIDGPSVALPATAAQALGLALHELATNAVKYGALSQPTGRLVVAWRVEAERSKRRITLEWRETGIVIANGGTRRRGYGTELIERALPYQLGAETRLEFGGDEVRCAIAVEIRDDHAEAAS